MSTMPKLNMAALTAETPPPETPAPETPEHKKTYTLELEADPGFTLTKATLQHPFKNGLEARFAVHFPLKLVDTPDDKPCTELAPGDQVNIVTGNGAVVAATFKAAHKNGKTGTFHTVWPLANAVVESKPEGSRKRAKRPDADADAGVPTEFRAPTPVVALYLCEKDVYPDATTADVAALLRELASFVAPANAAQTFVIMCPVLSQRYTAWVDGNSDAVRELARGYTVLASTFAHEALDILEIKQLLAKRVVPHGAEFAVVLAHKSATVLNDKLPNMAFNDDSWPARLARSPARSTTTTEPDSAQDSDNEDIPVHTAETIDLTAPDEPDAPPARPRAEKRKRPAEVEYVVLDDSDSDE